MRNGQQLYTFTPESFYRLKGLTPLSDNLLALIAAFGREGLRLSNYRLAKFFNVERGTIIDNIARLKSKRYITDEGTNKYKHRLVASSVILTLLGSIKRDLGGGEITPETVSKNYKTRVEKTPINKRNEQKRSEATHSPTNGQASLSPILIATLEDRKKILENAQDSTFKRSILAKKKDFENNARLLRIHKVFYDYGKEKSKNGQAVEEGQRQKNRLDNTEAKTFG